MFTTEVYDLEGHILHHGDGSNMYRGESFAQPRALRAGDVLANGWELAEEPNEGFNGSVVLKMSTGQVRFLPARIPLQLAGQPGGVLPADLEIGYILQTGCVILDRPKPKGPVSYHGDQEEVNINLTGGWDGHTIGVPADLELAVFNDIYPPRQDNPLGIFALERTLGMHEAARRNLPTLGQLGLGLQ